MIHRRRTSSSVLRRFAPGALLLATCFAGGVARAEDPPLARALHTVPVPGSVEESRLDPLHRFTLAWQTHDDVGAKRALEAEGWDDGLRHWLRARLARREGALEEALRSMRDAAEAWSDPGSERPEVLAVFDRERVATALLADDVDAAEDALATPTTAHDGDARWAAMRARVRLARGEAAEAAADLDAAWGAAAGREEEDPVFLWRAVAHLRANRPDLAAKAWTEVVAEVRRPEGLRACAAVWDAEAELREAASRGETLDDVLRWLVRLYRREEALAYAKRELEAGRAGDPAALHVFVAEQLYRLRRHEDLKRWLARPRPAAIDDEQAAELDAYPWGVARRRANGLDVARGFDAVAARYPNTSRATEAVWEAAWMWELGEQPNVAAERYLEYVKRAPDGPFAESAALRTVLLPYLEGRWSDALHAYDEVRGSLGDQMNDAAARWLRARCLAALDRREESQREWEELRGNHPDSPLWRSVPRPWSAPDRRGEAVEDVVERLYRDQRWALGVAASAVGLPGDPLDSLPEELVALRRLLDLGLNEEGESRLLDWGRSHRGDEGDLVRAVAVAWATGATEIQARLAWFLELRLRGRGADAERAGAILTRPTPYAAEVLGLSRELDVPAGLIWSLMRRESFYDADVVSLAGAYGLMQLLPSTASRVAQRWNDPDQPQPEQLFEPGRNLRYGMRYFRGLLDESGEDLAQSLAAYNAGERNGERWAARRPPEEPPALMMLLISYSETRAYVYHVLRHWWVFLDVYPALHAWDGLADS